VSIASAGERLCYARFELSATQYLQGDGAGAADNAQQALQACGARSSEVKRAVRWELERVMKERDDLKAPAEAYCQKFLSK
jgi:hypothetical protein